MRYTLILFLVLAFSLPQDSSAKRRIKGGSLKVFDGLTSKTSFKFYKKKYREELQAYSEKQLGGNLNGEDSSERYDPNVSDESQIYESDVAGYICNVSAYFGVRALLKSLYITNVKTAEDNALNFNEVLAINGALNKKYGAPIYYTSEKIIWEEDQARLVLKIKPNAKIKKRFDFELEYVFRSRGDDDDKIYFEFSDAVKKRF
jgi:hypothetical protein